VQNIEEGNNQCESQLSCLKGKRMGGTIIHCDFKKESESWSHERISVFQK